MKIAIGSDHAGFRLKEHVKGFLLSQGITVLDCGTDSEESCDYPFFCYAVAKAVASRRARFGILICKTGIGSAIAANKVKGIRAGLCHNPEGATLTREHNHANVLVMGAMFVSPKMSEKIISAFLKATPQKGRHARRVREISWIEDGSIEEKVPVPRCRRIDGGN